MCVLSVGSAAACLANAIGTAQHTCCGCFESIWTATRAMGVFDPTHGILTISIHTADGRLVGQGTYVKINCAEI